VAYGDIGTSPLYTMREAFGHAGGRFRGVERRPVSG
jgi:K+ transporter